MDGITNIIPIAKAKDKFQVTYVSGKCNSFDLHKPYGTNR